ncbi:katanin p60 ATPase-containing subunit A-like 2 [Microplitis demolitor]|uniref:katanin p60 ATPase-containing subunit A-like 2 n=1 Tax=Microplitis demolitor TaxID=69319 RepID=UPI0004CD0BAF|nr:katanin p60 ATPase-containing subunit A-like 2 [Microplitis demolitor]
MEFFSTSSTKHNNKKKYFLRQREDLLYMIRAFLRQENLLETSRSLEKEAGLSVNIEICDNIDLGIIFAFYLHSFLANYNKLPKICKTIEAPISVDCQKYFRNKNGNFVKSYSEPDSKTKPSIINELSMIENEKITGLLNVIQLSNDATKIPSTKRPEYHILLGKKKVRSIDKLYPACSEFHEIAQTIMKDIVLTNLKVNWSDIWGLEHCKDILMEAIIYPFKYPELFCDKFPSWQGILLYGPPGTGKTMLAKAVATECDWTFFNITASSLVSKWRGDSEKYIRILFEVASYQAPSVIFIDEIDWISGDNDRDGKSSEPARRFRAEFLTRLDGLVSATKDKILLLATTNAPWNLDNALLRRLEKHIFVDIPDEQTRRKILKYYTSPNLHGLKQFDEIVARTKFYSGSDLKRLCKEAWMTQSRMFIKLCEREERKSIQTPQFIDNIETLQEAEMNMQLNTKNLSEKYKKWKNMNK